MITRKLGFAGRIAHYFINSKLTPLIMVFAILLGAFAVLQTPREEEPQIVVPMMDVFVEMPGSTAQEVEQRVTTPMEKLIWEIPGVEYVYSTTQPGLSMAIVRFKVGEKEEDSIIKLYNKLYSHFDLIPPGASKPLVSFSSSWSCRDNMRIGKPDWKLVMPDTAQLSRSFPFAPLYLGTGSSHK